ncbi:MAG: hypothetical protein QOJ26_1200 [Thermoplasmata archaeon]|nr:hypothetical protein [Thermoplasmata archaeon]
MKAWLLVGILAVGAVAGCLDSGSGKDGTGSGNGAGGIAPQRYALPDDPMPEGPGHDHTDPAQHKFLWNYEFGSRDGLLQNAANVAGVHALDVQAGYLFGAVYGSHAAAVDGGLVIWDITADPGHPKQVGRWTIAGSVGGDRSMEATPDGDYAVISTEPVDCAGHVNPGGAPIQAYLLDTRDKTRPIVSDVLTPVGYTAGDVLSGGGGLGGPTISQHSVAVHRIQEEDYAFIAGKVYHIQRGEQGARLVYVSTIGTGHDMYIRDTPWGTTWAISANGGGGMIVTDTTDPAHPFQVATWDLPDRKDLATDYYFHTADVSFQPSGDIIFVLSSEDWGKTISPLWVLDGNPLKGITAEPTETTQLEMIGTWHNPGNHSALAGLTFSLHNPRFHDGGILTLSSYHGGMWQLDLRTPEFWADPAPIGYAAYAEGTPTVAADPVEDVVQSRLCGLEIQLDAPSYWDVEVGANGVTYLADGFMGLYAFTPAASHPVFGASRTQDFNGTAGT